jgi:hypothetical protein
MLWLGIVACSTTQKLPASIPIDGSILTPMSFQAKTIFIQYANLKATTWLSQGKTPMGAEGRDFTILP